MDLGTARARLEAKTYTTLRDATRDVRLVFENAFTYNGRDSEIGRLAQALDRTFEAELVRILDRVLDPYHGAQGGAHRGMAPLCGGDQHDAVAAASEGEERMTLRDD